MNKISINLDIKKGTVDPKIFGHFCEHAFGNIYGGVYDPESPNADSAGMRTDVVELLRKVKPSILRYPGGNFVSNYHWEDGIGPKENRRRVFEYAWLTEESNQFGTADFIDLCNRLEAEPFICVNMGNGTIEEAMNWVEYCNGTGNTYYANLRKSHGYEEPFKVKYWGLGNEMYGEWQMNHMSAEAYAEAAFQFAKAMKWVDPSIQLTACGHETNSDWNHTVIKRVGHLVDYISAHHYSIGWGPFERDNYMQSMYIPDYMEKLNNLTVAAIFTGSNDEDKRIKVAWDEWNMFGWVFEGVNDNQSYTLQNAIVTALVINMFIRNCNTIGMANYSTFVNINGAISVHGDSVITRPQYHVFDLLGNNTGNVLYHTDIVSDTFTITPPNNSKLGRSKPGVNVSSGKIEQQKVELELPFIDAVATGDDEGTLYVSVINKHPDKDIEVDILLYGSDNIIGEKVAYTIYHDDLVAANTDHNPENVVIREISPPVTSNNTCVFSAKKHSINLLKFKLG